MLTIDHINKNIPQLQLTDTVGKSLHLINDYRVTHLPVVLEKKFLGLVSEEDLLDQEDEQLTLDGLQKYFIQDAILNDIHFLNAVEFSLKHDSSLVPVVNQQREYFGAITTSDLLKIMGNFAGAYEIGGIIVLQMERPQFSISEISRLVENNDCHILHLNTQTDHSTGIFTVTLHVNHREIAPLVASFERHEYDVLYSYGSEKFENEIDSNYNHLMKYLDI
ncbi:MAG: CBS domain-containing protein [Chitinophagaceae bacterium]|jgi:CBS domain-containing protein|nr:CBS domain-containing protein [Chitinophagaceae bacterium]MBP6047492.1 CBS domain-containing protein [Ferruginibacter sp.]MBK7088758.1 CBS domain-containing protein [Chitinophagaceae bacterium]MBK7348055.1 CBS domain-containing protein [Chitinophagaceae bacterium]MBK7734694.1 CBS domain-containing protein [Chitinophagaceae bacterium]